MELAFESAINLAAKIKNKELSALELTNYYIKRIEDHDEVLNAVIIRDFDRARDAAKQADIKQASLKNQACETLGPLHGVPMTIKESFNVDGLPTSWGIEPLKGNVASSDALYVKSLKAAGAILLGKTNIPIQLGDFQSYNAIYGTTNNPWDISRTPGGSSGGSAAALAAGLTGIEAGSDIGGSIRNPAHYCGVYGHKPSFGIVPWQGHELPGMNVMADMAVVGPLARSAEDLRLCLELVAGPDPSMQPGWQLDLPQPNKKSLKDYRVAIWMNQEGFPVSQEIQTRIDELRQVLSAQGAKISDTARPKFDVNLAFKTYLSLLNGTLSTGIADDHYKHLQDAFDAIEPTDNSIRADTLRFSVQDHRMWNYFDNVRAAKRLAWKAFFQDWDILICPQMPTTAFPHNQSALDSRTSQVDGENTEYFNQLFWSGLIGASYLPSTVFPTGLSALGLPIGLQAVGAEFSDYQCIDFARLITKEIGGFTPPSAFT